MSKTTTRAERVWGDEHGEARKGRRVGAIDMTAWKVDSVEDTRQWDLDEGKPIPGTGTEYPCAHCGRTIEVHVHLVRVDGSDMMTVGTGCLGRGLGEKYARAARANYENKVERCKQALRKPWTRGYGYTLQVPHDSLVSYEAWDTLAALDKWKADRRKWEAAVIRYLAGDRLALNVAFYAGRE